MGCHNNDLKRSSSNAALLLTYSDAKFDGMDLRELNLEDTDIQGASFIKADLSNTIIKRVNISKVDFLGANLTNAFWTELISTELAILEGHTSDV